MEVLWRSPTSSLLESISEWLLIYHSQPEEETDIQKTTTKTSNHNNTTSQTMGNILISQSTNMKNNLSLQTL